MSDHNQLTNSNKSTTNKSIGINAILNMIRVGCSIALPLITFPYVSRVLQVENLGKINYGNSIVNYFALFAALGISTYGVREGAGKKKGKEFDLFASEIYTLNIITTIISYSILFLFLLIVPKFRAYKGIILIQSLTIILTTLGIEWVNTIFEDFRYITIRSILVQLLGLLSLFVFVRNTEDYLKYVWISVLSSSMICLANRVYCRRYTKLKIHFSSNVFSHIKPMFVFFANSVAVTIYVSADTIMLGWISGDYYTGLYAVSVKIYQAIKMLLTAVYTVTIPRLSKYAKNAQADSFKTLMTQIACYVILLVVPCMIGLIVYAKNIILIMSGESYLQATRSLQILSIALLFSVGSGMVVNCINTPNGFEKNSFRATAIASLMNIGLNVFLIPWLHQDGAAITTVLAEAIVIIICLTKLQNVNRYVDVHEIVTSLCYAGIGSVFIFMIRLLVEHFMESMILSFILGMILSIIVYLGFLYIGKNKYVVLILSVIKKRQK